MILYIFLFFFTTLLALLFLPRLVTGIYTLGKIYSVEDAPSTEIGLVFGAGLRRDGTPTPVLQDRVKAGVELYQAGKVKKLLMSGDNRFKDYNEPASMRAYAMSLGVPSEDIVLDYAGQRTYDSCYRAKHIFGVKNVALITQEFHLPRALFICRYLELDALGVKGDLRTYSRASQTIWFIRELPATFVALYEVWISHPLPVMGQPEPIELNTPEFGKDENTG